MEGDIADDSVICSRFFEAAFNWKPITDEFTKACSELQLGELLHDSSFGLLEAMSAIEMMDPKMDAGMVCNQTKRKVLRFDQGVQCGVVKINNLERSELIGIIDETFACLVTWLEGHSLAQTVLINLYLHDPDAIEDRCLKAFCVGILRIVDKVRERVSRAGCFEEEDFQPMSYGFKMASDVPDAKVLGMFKEAEDDLNKVVKSTRSKMGEERDAETITEHDLSSALFARVRFTKLLLSTLLVFSKEKCVGFEDAQKFLGQMSDLLSTMKASLALGIKPQVLSGEGEDQPSIMGFEPLVNQRLLPPTFPRYTKIRSREDTVTYLEDLVNRLKAVTAVTKQNGLHNLMEFFLEFSKPAPCVLSRSLLQLSILPQNRKLFGSEAIVNVMRDAVKSFIMPPYFMPKSPLAGNAQALECVECFLQQCVQPMLSVLQISGHNRARQREKWGHLLEDFSALQDEADRVDAYLHQLLVKAGANQPHYACFGTWVLYHTLQTMLRYMLSGLELELYAVHEYHYIFWYLFELLYGWLTTTISRASNFLEEQENSIEQQLQQGKGNKAGKKSNKKKKGTATVKPYFQQITIAEATRALCCAYYNAVMGLRLDGKLPLPRSDFDNEEVRYNHRFGPFSHLGTPPPVDYVQFKEVTRLNLAQSRYSPEVFYDKACQGFQQARNIYESIPTRSEEVQTLTKVAKINFVVCKLLKDGHKKDSKVALEFNFSIHKVFPVIKIS